MSVPVPEIERVAYEAWPARETATYDGWLLRHGDGFSRRINSVAAGPSTVPIDEKLDYCRRWYGGRGPRCCSASPRLRQEVSTPNSTNEASGSRVAPS